MSYKSAQLIDMKVAESDYFLNEIKNSKVDVLIINSLVNAFVSSCRNITFALQYVLHNTEGFHVWYNEKKEYMKKNIFFRFFNEYRRLSIHERQYFIKHGDMINGKISWYFGTIKDIQFNDDVFIICNKYFIELLQLILDSYQEFKLTLSAKWYYTQNNFKLLNKTIFEAETELGFPSNWTKINDNKEELPERWAVLRRNVTGCEINHLFKMYLNKYFQEPDGI